VYQLVYAKQAHKALLKMPRNTAQLVRKKLEQLAKDPHQVGNVKKLTDHPGFRLRVGDWRAPYTLDTERLVVQVVRIAPRGGVYR